MRITNKVKRVATKYVCRSDWYNNVMFGNCAKFWNHNTFEMDLVNLGSSSALAAFDYSQYPQLKSANWAMAPQTLVADHEILRNYSCYLREGATVIISICPFSCLGGSNDYLPDKYYTILDIASIPHASYARKQQILHIRNNPLEYFPLIQLFVRKKKKNNKLCDELSLETDAKNRMEGWKREFSIKHFTDPLSIVNTDAYHDGISILKKMIDYCIERKFKPVVVMPPVSNALRIYFSEEMKKRNIDQFVQKATNDEAPFLDFFNDRRFDNSHFRDAFLLNSKGAKLFTELVLKELEVIR